MTERRRDLARIAYAELTSHRVPGWLRGLQSEEYTRTDAIEREVRGHLARIAALQASALGDDNFTFLGPMNGFISRKLVVDTVVDVDVPWMLLTARDGLPTLQQFNPRSHAELLKSPEGPLRDPVLLKTSASMTKNSVRAFLRFM